ncbi:MAG: hypothetical protein HQ445_05475 [Polaromonas sp.]|nr:hypothetical protein [Polaromonas sp.]
MSHHTAMNAPLCCTHECTQGRTCQRNAPNLTVDHGAALKKINSGINRHIRAAWVLLLMWLASVALYIAQI